MNVQPRGNMAERQDVSFVDLTQEENDEEECISPIIVHLNEELSACKLTKTAYQMYIQHCGVISVGSKAVVCILHALI